MYTTGEIQEKSKEFKMSDDTILPTKTFTFYQKSEKKNPLNLTHVMQMKILGANVPVPQIIFFCQIQVFILQKKKSFARNIYQHKLIVVVFTL